MASQQSSRRENITTERKIHGEKDYVPQMTTRVEHLSVKERELPQGSVEGLQGGEINKDSSGKTIGDIAGRGKASQAHDLGPNFQSLPDLNENQIHLDHARVPVNANVAESRVGGENATRGKLDDRTRVVTGTPHVKEQNRALGKEQVVAERGRKTDDLEARRKEKISRGQVLSAENQDEVLEKSVSEEKERARERAKEATKETLNDTARAAQEKGAQALEKAAQAKDATAEKTQQGYEATKDAAKTAAEKASQAKDATLEKGQQGYEATKDTVSNAAKTAAEKAAQAKDATLEKSQQGYEATKDTVSNAAKTAAEKAAQAKNATLEKTQQGYEATKNTVSNAAKTASDYVTPAAEKTKSAAVQAKDVTLETGKTAAERAKCAAVQAKDVTVEKGKTAAEIAGKVASVAGWTATHYATQLTVDGTKAAANAVEGAVGYVAPKASELAAKSVETVKGLAASAGETAKEFTARKKDESWREYEAQKASQPQEGEEILAGENVNNYTQKVTTQKVIPSEERIQAQGTNLQEKGRGSNVMPNTGETETVENVLEKERGKEGEILEKKNDIIIADTH